MVEIHIRRGHIIVVTHRFFWRGGIVIVELHQRVCVVCQSNRGDGTRLADRVASHIKALKGVLEIVGLGVSRRIEVHQILTQGSAKRDTDDGMLDSVGADKVLRSFGTGHELISIGVVDGVEIDSGMIVIRRIARQGIHQLVHMHGLQDVSVAIIVVDAQLQHQRIQNGRCAEALSS